jgi:hypothetical protein
MAIQISLGLVAIYVFVVALLLLIVVYTRLPWLLKTGLILGSTAFFFLSFDAFTKLEGLPAVKPPPQQLLYVSTLVREPQGTDPGAIYLWVRPIIDGKASPVPQAFQIRYSRELHKRMNEARGRDHSGRQVMLETHPIDDQELEEGPGMGYQMIHMDVVIQDLPEGKLPEKMLRLFSEQGEE